MSHENDLFIQVVESLKSQLDELKSDTRRHSEKIIEVSGHISLIVQDREKLRELVLDVRNLGGLVVGDGDKAGVLSQVRELEKSVQSNILTRIATLDKELKEVKRKMWMIAGVLGAILLLTEGGEKILKIMKGVLL